MVKIVLVEGAGRWSLATGKTIYEGRSRLGTWTLFSFGPYIVIWGFVYGAAAMAGTGLPLHWLFPFASVTFWGILSGLVGAVLVWLGRYAVFVKVCAALVALMFVMMVGAAALTLPNLGELLKAWSRRSRPGRCSTCCPSPGESAARSPLRRMAIGCARRAGPPRVT